MKAFSNILVTGGAGFIGSHTVDLLLREGKFVTVLDNLYSGKLSNLNLSHPNLAFIEGDVLEFPYLSELIADCDAVIHLAAIASVPLSIQEPLYSFSVNTQGFLHVLEAIRNASHPVRLIYASSAAVYGEVESLPCDDTKPLTAPVLSPYALQKRHNEQYATLYAQLHGVKSLGLRYFNVYGTRQDPLSPYSGVISRFRDLYQQNAELVIYGDGQQARDFVAIQDVVTANKLALESNYMGFLNIATGMPQTLLQLIAYLEQAGHQPARKKFDQARAGDIKTSYATTQLAKDTIQFQSTITLEAGMKQLLQAQNA